jgi:hypothetical protein
MTSRRRPQSGTIFYAAAVLLSLAVGALQMARVHGGWLTDYGADVFGTAWLYALARQGRTFLRRATMPPWQAAALVFACCAASEFAQRAGVLSGVFDPRDLAAYAATVTACAVLDHALDFSRGPA